MADIMQRFFHLPLGEDVGNYYLQLLARGLMGDLLKKICFCLGDSNTGKSTITKAVQSSCGAYVGAFNTESPNAFHTA